MDSITLLNVGNKEIGRYCNLSDLNPTRLNSAVTCAILKMSGKCPMSKQLFNNRYKGKETGVAIIERNLAGTPQCDGLRQVGGY